MKLKLLIAFILLAGVASAQTNLVSYEYWFNNDYANVQTTTFSPATQHVLNTNIDISALPNNLNVLNIRYKDENGKYSSTLSKLFVKMPDMGTPGVNNLVSYEYWFNNDYANVQTTSFSPAPQHVLNTNIDISALPNNLNVLNIRYKDENGKYSSTLSKLFVKMPDMGTPGVNNLVSYEYWFNNDYANVQTTTFSPAPQHVVNTNIDISALPNNLNVLNIRYKDENGKYSSTLSKLFVKMPDMGTPGVNNLVSYEYWFNNDYANVQTTTFSPATQHVLNTNIDISALPNNLNVLNIRYKDENGKYSSTLSKLFVKMPNSQIIDNKLTDYMYWFDDDFSNAITVTLPQNMQAHNWVELLPLPSNMEGGTHEINIRFKDSLNMWSVPFTKTFTKGYAPRAEFNGMESEFCYGTMLKVTPNPVDVDSIYWNFGDGTPIQKKHPAALVEHLYASAGNYTITATMKHIASGISADTIFAITVHPSYGTFGAIEYFISENFETTPLGSLPDGWVLKYNGTGEANQKVVDYPVMNGEKALQLEGASGWTSVLYKALSEFPDQFTVESWMQTNSMAGGGTAGAGSFAVSNINVGTWGSELARVVFNGGNITYFYRSGYSLSTIYTLQSYQIDEWYHIKMNVDLTTKTTTIFINGQQVSADDGNGNIITDFPIHPSVEPTDIILVAGNDGVSKMFFDDVRMYSGYTISNPIEVNLSVCDTELPYSFGTQSLTATGVYTETFQTTHSCDSTVIMNFNVNPAYEYSETIGICSGGDYTFHDGTTITNITSNTSHVSYLQSVNACDSVITTHIEVIQIDNTVTHNLNQLTANQVNANYQWLNCDDNYSPINGETNQSFTATQNGSYAVAVTHNGCTDTSDCYVITSVGLLENSFDSNIIVYPNPTDGLLTVQLGNMHSIFSVTITDMSGKEILKSIYNNTDNFELNLNAQPGIYLMKIISGDKRAIIRLAIN